MCSASSRARRRTGSWCQALILQAERDGANAALDGFGADLDAAVGGEAGEAENNDTRAGTGAAA